MAHLCLIDNGKVSLRLKLNNAIFYRYQLILASELILQSESLNCFSVIKATWDVLHQRGSNDEGLLELSKLFRACK